MFTVSSLKIFIKTSLIENGFFDEVTKSGNGVGEAIGGLGGLRGRWVNRKLNEMVSSI